MAKILRCGFCGTDNAVGPAVMGKLCETCGKIVLSQEIQEWHDPEGPAPEGGDENC